MGAFSGTRLDSPPPPPPDVSGQTGASPFAGMSQMIGDKLGKKPGEDSGGQAHPQGAVLAMFEAVKKAAEQMAKISDGMKPFVDRAMSILEQGVGEVVSKGGRPGSPGPESPEQKPGGDASARPTVGPMSSFPG